MLTCHTAVQVASIEGLKKEVEALQLQVCVAQAIAKRAGRGLQRVWPSKQLGCKLVRGQAHALMSM